MLIPNQGFEHHHLTEEERERLKRKREAAAELRSRWEHQNRLMENEQHFFNGDESLGGGNLSHCPN